MKGINNRQKMVVRARENIQKYISQQKSLQKANSPGQRTLVRRPINKKNK